MRVNDIRKIFIDKHITTNSNDMLEIIGASFEADESTIFGKINEDYVDKEIKWYLSQSLSVYDMKNPPKIWKDIADRDGKINSNYGWCVFSEENYSQYENVLNELRKNPESRRGTMIYNRPSMHRDSVTNGMNDFICTMGVHYFIRDNRLQTVVQMRSNDVVFGYKNDYYWQNYLRHRLAEDLGLEVGKMIWQVATLHIYPRHRYLIERSINESNN